MDIIGVIKEYLQALQIEQRLSPSTIISYRSDLGLFAKFAMRQGILELQNIDSHSIRKFLLELQQLYSLKATTLRRRIHALRSFYNYCIDEDYVIKNPMRKIKCPKKEQPLPIFLTDEEAKRFLDTPTKDKQEWLRKRDKAILDVLFFTGIRRNELLGLAMDDINLNEWSLRVIKGKGGKDRLLPLNSKLIKSIREYLAVRPKSRSNKFFVSYNYNAQLTKAGLYKLFRTHLRNAKITRKGISPHKIRHTFATMVLRGSRDIVAVQELLGHTDISTTRIYLHTTTEQLRGAVEKHPMG